MTRFTVSMSKHMKSKRMFKMSKHAALSCLNIS